MIEYKDISKTDCKPKLIFGKHHGIPLTKCFAGSDVYQKEMIKFLEEIFQILFGVTIWYWLKYLAK